MGSLAGILPFVVIAAPFSPDADAQQSIGQTELRFLRPAFDHLGNLGDQAEAATASGCTLIYATGIGKYSYSGLPPRAEMDAYLADRRVYNERARRAGARVILSYLCATSIVNIDRFAANWDQYFPNRSIDFDPHKMLQQDIDGLDLPSWYGGDYSPADMWNPKWRAYTKLCIELAVESGHDGVFFDNPTVSLKGNYSLFAMRAWASYLGKHGIRSNKDELSQLRRYTVTQGELWRRFRTTEAADFLREMRKYGRSLNPNFVLTANNSLNSWDSFYSQPRGYAYSIPEQSRNEDSVTIEDMSSQPRKQDDRYVSYAGTLRMIGAIAEGRPLSICTTDGDYVASPNLLRLSIAECAAHGASYMVWSCWEPKYRTRNAEAARKYHDFISVNHDLFDGAQPVSDIALVWPYENWIRRSDCPTVRLAKELSGRNIQFDAVIERQLTIARLSRYRTVVMAANEALYRPRTERLLENFKQKSGRVLKVEASPSAAEPNAESTVRNEDLARRIGSPDVAAGESPGVRAIVRKSRDGRVILHLYNLNVTRIDSYHDVITPVEKVRIKWTLPRGTPAAKFVELRSPDTPLPLTVDAECRKVNGYTEVGFAVPKLIIWTIAVLRHG